MATKRDYYEVLGVAKSANNDEIKRAYRKLALQWHPDRNKAAHATEKFKEINEAYSVLSDANKKAQYDRLGHAGVGSQAGPAGGQQGPFQYSYNYGDVGDFFKDFSQGGYSGGDFNNPFDIFESFFGSRTPPRQQKTIYRMELTFIEAARGIEKTVKINNETKRVKIPAGVSSGTRIRFSEFDILVEIEDSKLYQREGQDLYYELHIDYADAILGTTVEIPTLEKKVKTRIKPGTQPNTVIRLRGFGLPYPRANQKGDFYIVVRITIPTHVSGKEKQLLEEIRTRK
ncbi:MAG: DnaJ domain-containing protein [Candidatus Roizmanbacteria bacterium]|nr:DnaJ domain-containing protein [Candidatus Roizmanbacteria bacterium]